jgi:L-ascorbate metabolism protein UlaG (beta-lactamase superfamily)
MVPLHTPIADSLREPFAPYFEDPERAGSFHNPWPHAQLPSLLDLARWKTGANPLKPRGYRAHPVELTPNAYAEFAAASGSATRLFWIGHASFLLEQDGARFVVDPIFDRAGGFVARVTPPAARPEQLNALDAVLITHGHHDHCDPHALRALAQVNQGRTLFVVPRGLGKVLPRECEPRVELSWWQYVTVAGVRIHLVPAQHWHRRGMFDLNRALWGSYVLEGTHRLYHSGDTGYFGGFRAIGAVFGGIDAACLPLGAYEPRWFMASQHMSPEQSVTACSDLSATHFVGMHWGAYDLSNEPIEAGSELLREVVREQQLDAARMHVLRPGGSVALAGPSGATTARARHCYP